jgi:DNA uptake protein ComE-like DNA-binding protein
MFRRLINHLKILFGISSTEARGVLVLIPVLVILIFLPSLLKKVANTAYDLSPADEARLDSIYNQLKNDYIPFPSDSSPHRHGSIRPVYFDPNTAGEPLLDSAGIPANLVQRIINYRKAGGVFRTRNDLMRIYGFPKDLHEEIYDFITLPEKLPPVVDVQTPKIAEVIPMETVPVTVPSFDLNQADSITLLAIRGIGPVLAGRIIKYRKRLGGFVEVNQLNEVYGLKDPALNELKDHSRIEPDFVPEKRKINFLEWKELVSHPYIDKNLATNLIRYRTTNGPYHSIRDLLKIPDVTDSLILRLEPYLEF